jgi:hypothetical protein
MAFAAGTRFKSSLIGATVAIVAVLAVELLAAAAQAPAGPLLARFHSKTPRTPASYRGHRRLEASNLRFKLTGWLEASTTFDAGQMQYTITNRGGSELIQKRVLIAALEAERELVRDDREIAISDANYVFEESGADADGVARIRLKPKRKDKRLLDGYMLLSPDADILEVSGALAKAPSFWTTSVKLTRKYRYVGEIRLPEIVTSVADVRIAGRSTFSMTYEFDVVDGTPVEKIR